MTNHYPLCKCLNLRSCIRAVLSYLGKHMVAFIVKKSQLIYFCPLLSIMHMKKSVTFSIFGQQIILDFSKNKVRGQEGATTVSCKKQREEWQEAAHQLLLGRCGVENSSRHMQPEIWLLLSFDWRRYRNKTSFFACVVNRFASCSSVACMAECYSRYLLLPPVNKGDAKS